jgi:hypothetical protein
MSENKDLVELKADDLDSIQNILSEVEDAFFDIPFGNSAFQTKAFVVAASITPERAYRTIGLQLMSILRSLRTNLISKQIAEIKLEQKKEKINDPSLDKYEKRILELEVLEDSTTYKSVEKSVNDTFNEFKVLYTEFKKLPKFTREQFENGEMNYYTQSLTRQAHQLDGAVQSIVNIFEDMPALNHYSEQIKQIENLDSQTLENLRLAMDNQFDNARKRVEEMDREKLNMEPQFRLGQR